jgi:hypothetical protein
MMMKRIAFQPAVLLAFILAAGGAPLFAQATFKIPFKFEAAGRKFPAGTYWIGIKDDKNIEIRQESKGLDVAVPILEKLPQPVPPLVEPELGFDVVGNFAPSYSEYVTDYVLSEVWLSGQDGLLIRRLKGAHQHQAIKAEKPAS